MKGIGFYIKREYFMAYFLNEEKKGGEIATFTSPKICEHINIVKIIDKEEITGLTISFLGKDFFCLC
ncbi:hypothetical protein EII40_13680 [Tannerella forsythia]|uniref:Uncharacterized protein n=1 Tax=Tannerella forsythia TaxID=28112 RepID=A0A3P1XDR0_TANFO|nr:hypothetical protein EII40_13680 [Tannerella forsythia]